ncbi:MAG: histidine kinase, partial [Pseudonocardiales bacterium]
MTRSATRRPASTVDAAGVTGTAAEPGRIRPETLLTVAALPLMLVLSLAGHGRPSSITWTIVVIVLAWLPLTVRSRWPLPVLGVVLAVETVDIAFTAHAHPAATILPVATMLALYTVAARHSARLAWAATAVVAAVQFGVALINHPTGLDWLYLNWAVVATVSGRLMKERQDRIAAADLRAENAERTKQAEADRQVTAERIRIAHELHDVLAHHIAVVNAQAGVAQYLLQRDPAAASTALAGITANSKAALDELRATLGLLRAEGDPMPSSRRAPTPTLEQLDRLLEGFTAAGMRLHTFKHGIPGALSGPAELAFYRIVQEALTNATKHAPGSDVRLDIDWAT